MIKNVNNAMIRISGSDLVRIVEGSVRRFLVESTDREYLELYERGDSEGAMRMVRDAAAAAMPNTKVVVEKGSPIVLYHGTSKDKMFYKFKKSPRGTWFTDSKDSAESYAKDNDSRKLVYDWNTGNYKEINTNERVYTVFLNADNMLDLSNEKAPEEYRSAKNYSAYQKQMFEKIRMQGYDAVRMYDGSYVVFEPNQIKSADPFTFDNHGQLIPLSKRFDFTKDDIRY